ncbi:hypothetical protein LX36DRAFT_590830, partial [Colletotrichum falcatum]
LSMSFHQHRLFYYITIIRGSLASLIRSGNLDLYLDLTVNSFLPLTLVSTNVRIIYRSSKAIVRSR